MEAVKETLSKDQLEAMEDFSIKESEKIVARLKELKEQFDACDACDVPAGCLFSSLRGETGARPLAFSHWLCR